MSGKHAPSTSDDMEYLDDPFLPLVIKDEPLLDESYGVMGNFSITDLGEDEIKLEIKEEPTESLATELTMPDAPRVVQESAIGRETRPRRTTRKSQGSATVQSLTQTAKKSLQAKVYTLKEITRMSGRQLVQNFSEMSSNEMTRYFAYTCCLMPEICSNFFTSFGSETDARNKMQKHILQHVKNLTEKSQKNPGFTFYAESILKKTSEEVPAVKRRSQAKAAKEQATQQPKNDSESGSKHISTRRSSRTESVAPKPLEDDELASLEIIDLNDIKIEKLNDFNGDEDLVHAESSVQSEAVSTVRGPQKKRKKPGETDSEWKNGRKNAKKKKPSAEVQPEPIVVAPSATAPESGGGTPETSIVEMSWRLDHAYDVRHYEPADAENGQLDGLDEDIHYYEKSLPEFSAKSVAGVEPKKLPWLHFSLQQDDNVNPYKLLIPILTVPLSNLPADLNLLPNNPFEECDDIELPPSKYRSQDESSIVPKIGGVSEFEVYSGLDFSVDATEEEIKRIEALRGRWTHDHIRILSKYYLKELGESKGKNRKKKTLCGCKICPNKKFTAITTLYYHYISHTGEKPFKCSRCDKGFTRRHSLNYHAMTHNNTNRFKCPVCLKQFRHTSHYKDHVKQHTGENESDCKICNTTFKSKTAFNRHLKTKHNVVMIATNKASRIMTPSKINQLHLQQEAAMSSLADQGDSEDLGAVNGNGTHSPTKVDADVPSERFALLGREVKVEPLDEPEASSSLPANVIVVQPETRIGPFAVLRRKPNILKARLVQRS